MILDDLPCDPHRKRHENNRFRYCMQGPAYVRLSVSGMLAFVSRIHVV